MGRFWEHALAAVTSNEMQTASVVVSLLALVVTLVRNSQQSLRSANQQIYQALEFGSIDLFRFECDHKVLVGHLWNSTPDVSKEKKKLSETEAYQLREYICQMLNLFEMACRFRQKKLFEAEIFGSWIIWMWELCSCPVYAEQWEADLKWNYVPQFRDIMSEGIKIARATPGERDSFFKFVAHNMGDDDYIAKWFGHGVAPNSA